MKKTLLAFVAGIVPGLAGGFAIGIFVYPYLFLADIVAADSVDEKSAGKVVATGTFVHANPNDPIHHGKGQVTVRERVVHLGADFEVGPGPKYHVYLVPEKNVIPSTAVEKTMFVDLGRLRAFKGSQNYSVPDGLEPAKYGSVVIWCKQFGVLISPAALKFQ